MASVKKPDGNGGCGVDEVLKPFYQRASEAEERLARLEMVFAKKQDISSQEFSSVIKDFSSKLEIAQNELNFEREKTSKEIQKLLTENAKLQYRISHLVQALREMDSSSPLSQGA